MEPESIAAGQSELEAFENTYHYNLVRDIQRGCDYFWSTRGGDPADRHKWNRRGTFAKKRTASGLPT